jgi:hypothetical protein
VPIISRFRGIAVYLYVERGVQHHLPHIHVRAGSYRATFSIAPPGLLAGTLPQPQLRLVLAWAELHQDELMENWHLVQNDERPRTIEGL